MFYLFEVLAGIVAFFGGVFVVVVMPIMSFLNWRRVTRLQGEVLSLRQQLSGLRKSAPSAEASVAPPVVQAAAPEAVTPSVPAEAPAPVAVAASAIVDSPAPPAPVPARPPVIATPPAPDHGRYSS